MRNGSTRQWRKARARVLARDRGICHICGAPGADAVDHIVPVARGGTDDLDNLAAAHHDRAPFCNRRKADKLEHEQRLDLRTSGSLRSATN